METLQDKIAQIRADADKKIAAAEACARVLECLPAAVQPHAGFMYHHGGKQGTWVRINKDPEKSFRGPLFTLDEALEMLTHFEKIEPTVAWVDGCTHVERKSDMPEGAKQRFNGRDYLAKVNVGIHNDTSLIFYTDLECGRVRIEIAFACPFALRKSRYQPGAFGRDGRYIDCSPISLRGADAIQWGRGDDSYPNDVDHLIYDMSEFRGNAR